MVITFAKFDSAKIQSIIESDIVSISMGNTYDFTQLQDKIVICPKLDENGEGVVVRTDDPEQCNNINAIDHITCTEFKIPCPTANNHKFFFRIVTPGEVYSLGEKTTDGTVKAAESGLLSCKKIWDDYIAGGENFVDIPIVNDHFLDSVGLSRHFHFTIEK